MRKVKMMLADMYYVSRDDLAELLYRTFGHDERRNKIMNRNEQFEILENLFTWEIEEVGHFTIAFFAHYQLLNNMIENCTERFKTIDIPRVDYLIYKEHIYAIYAEFCVVIETLLKSLLEENGYKESEIRKKGHNLNALLDEIVNIDVPKINEIRQKLKSHQSVIDYFVNNNIFVDARYMSYKEDLSLMHIDMIRDLIMDLDFIYEKYYKYYDWVNILYPDTM